MVARAVSAGRGVAGLVSYLMHDQASPEHPRPDTSERVDWAATVGGSPTDDVALNVRIMQGVTADADVLKQLAGVSNRGRKLQDPYAHFVTSWSPGETVSREQMLDVTNRQLKALGCSEHLAVVIAHKDTAHPHCHLVVCKVHPETGRAAPLKQSGLKLSRVAEQWEREHGGIVIENRVKRREAREAFTAAVSREMAGFEADKNASPREQRAQQHAARVRAQTAAREQHPLPPMERQRGAGREPRPAGETARWNQVYRAHQSDGTLPAEARPQRVAVAALHRAARVTPALEIARSCRVDGESRPARRRPQRVTTGGERGALEAVADEAATPARSSPVSYEHQVNLAADKAEAHLPTIQHSRSGLSLVAISDDTFRRLTAGTDDQFVKDTISAVSGRQPLQYSPPEYEQFEEAYHRSAIDREHGRRLAAHQAEHSRRWWQLRRTSTAPEPERRASAVEVIQRHLPQLRRIFEESCAWVRQQFQGRLAKRRKDFDALPRTPPPPPTTRTAARPRPPVTRPPAREAVSVRTTREADRADAVYVREQLRRGADPAELRAELERRRQDKPIPRYYAQRTVREAEHELDRVRQGPSR